MATTTAKRLKTRNPRGSSVRPIDWIAELITPSVPSMLRQA